MKIRNYCSGSSNSDGMKNWLLSTLFVGTHILSAQSSDTLSTATILAEGLDFSENRTVVDSTQLGLLDIATYLQKRFPFSNSSVCARQHCYFEFRRCQQRAEQSGMGRY